MGFYFILFLFPMSGIIHGEKARVVVIGGGIAGAGISRKLSKLSNVELTMVVTKNFSEFTPSVVKVLASGKVPKDFHIQHANYLTNAKLVVGRVTAVGENHVHVVLIKENLGGGGNQLEENKDKALTHLATGLSCPGNGVKQSKRITLSKKHKKDDIFQGSNAIDWLIGRGYANTRKEGEE